MAAITYDKIKIICPWDIVRICELAINQVLNQHATLHLQAIVTADSSTQAILLEHADTQIKVYIDDNGDKYYLFVGQLLKAATSFQGGVYIITADCLSETVILDRKEKSRSFQNTNLTYADIVQQIMKDYPGKKFELTAPPVKVNGPLIQYQETDWQFIKRLGSYQQTVIVPDIDNETQGFAYGYPKGGKKELPDDTPCTSGKNLITFYEAKAVNPAMMDGEFAYFEAETYAKVNIGDTVTFRRFPLLVGAVRSELNNGVLVYTVTLIREMAVRQNPIYNQKLTGVSLEGKVLKLQDQAVKLHLSIDREQNPEEAYWYPFAPPTTDFMYLMPQLGTMASLYIPGLKEQDAVIIGMSRTNGAACQKTGDPNTRYIGTEYGQELKVAPGGIYITAGNEELAVHLDDDQGVLFSSPGKMQIDAQEISFKAGKSVSFNAPSQILLTTPQAFISMENEIYVRAFPNVCIDCSDETALPPVDQPKPQRRLQRSG